MNKLYLFLFISCLSFSSIGCGDAASETDPEDIKKSQEQSENADYEQEMMGAGEDK